MITWLQNATSKHHRIIFGFLLVVIVVSFVFYGFAGRGALSSGSSMYQGVDLNDPSVRARFRDATFFAQMTGQRMNENGLVQRVAELSLADSLGIPSPSVVEIRRFANEMTTAPDGKSAEGLNKFVEFAAKQLNVSDDETRARFEAYIVDTWRIQKAISTLAGSGHATSSQIKRILDRERTNWTVDVATFSAAGFKPEIKVDDAKVKESFTVNIENYRLPPQVAVTAVTITPSVADTAPVSDDEIINMGYNQAEKFKFETGKVKEQALAKRAELEKFVRADRAITNLAGQISDELAEKFAIDTAKADSKELAAWIKAKNAKVTVIPSFEVINPPTVAKIPAEALRVAGELNEKEWRTEVYRSEEGATFILLNVRTADRLPTYEEAKIKAVENWKKSQLNRLLAEEVAKVGKALQADIAAGKSFTDSAKAHKLVMTSPAAFSIYSLPEALKGADANTGPLIEAAGVGKLTSAIRVANGDHVFIRPAKKDLTEDKTNAEEARMFVQRVSQRNAYFTGIGLVQEVVPAPVQAK
jgi:peptidyl-prolyl cis-trans isomerase D